MVKKILPVLFVLCLAFTKVALAGPCSPEEEAAGCLPGAILHEDGTLEYYCDCSTAGGTPAPEPGPTGTPAPTPTPGPTPTPDPYAVCPTYCVVPPESMFRGSTVMVDLFYLCDDPSVLVGWIEYDEIPPHCESHTPTPAPTPGDGYPPQLLELFVACQCPDPTVRREPFPRGMVTVENRLWIEGAPSAEASSDPEDWGDYHDYRVHLRWEMLPHAAVWDFDDGTTATGNPVFHIYNASSWGKPANGPGLGGRHDLPAYQVRLTTRWQALWKETWWEPSEVDRWECVACGDPAANCSRDECPECSGDNARCWTETIRDYHDSGWQVMDLRDLVGYPTWYFERVTVEPVPVIEVQGIITE